MAPGGLAAQGTYQPYSPMGLTLEAPKPGPEETSFAPKAP